MRLILLETGDAGPHCVMLFGTGLIGGAIETALLRSRGATALSLPYSWSDGAARAAQRAAIRTALAPGASELTLLWAAGSSGFGSSPADMARETALLGELLDFMHTLWEAAPDARRSVHMMSSAGGLFEGVTQCGADTVPAPRRAYGEGKLAQERRAAALDASVELCIYRPSSVYGVSPSGRVGLITALIGNAFSGRTTRIVGTANTLRDYVASEDIGRFVARRIRTRGPRQTYILARGRAASTGEVIGHVEAVLGRRLYLQFDPRPSNALDMSFRPQALPKAWTQRDLATGIANIAMQLRHTWTSGHKDTPRA